ncbi:MAG: Na+/H+ antiporter subunit E [Bacteroidetes bacterium]|nr:Na+/H+ antiporter subunit E [Bacteroidota bacterium]
MNLQRSSLPMRILKGLGFTAFYAMEVVLSSFRVALDILSPRLRIRPGIIAIPLCELTERQILVLSNLVTMTPGTLSLDISDDNRTLYLHHMNVRDVERLRRQIEKDYVTRIREIF